MSIAGWSAQVASERPQPACPRDARLPIAVARIPTFLALAGFGAWPWARMIAPAAWGAMAVALLAALAAAAVLVEIARRRLAGGRRTAATLLVAAVLLVVALAVAGTPAELAAPRAWDDLATGIAQGVGAVPNLHVPYRGADHWTRLVIVLGGVVLVGLAALLAFAPRRDGALGSPIAAALVLGALYLVPVMQHNTAHQFLGGAAFTLLLALFLWLERVERHAAGVAAGVVAVAILAALALGPRVDGDAPLLDYEQLAQSLTSVSTRYDWNHGYGPLSWPRDGREVLRVRASDRSYWKATNLSVFDGTRWVQGDGPARAAVDVGLDDIHPQWRQTLVVTVRALRSAQFIAAGTTLSFVDAPPIRASSGPGAFSTVRQPLRRGNAYRVVVYTPRPSARELRAAARRPLPAAPELTSILLPPARPTAGPVLAMIPPWGQGEPARSTIDALESSPYARAYDLARRLRATSSSPYELMRAVERLLSHGYRYSERPRRSATPLMEFLFGQRSGYCQHFSGAMALLLRLAGVPTRVAAGFSPGVFDHTRKEYVVRDYDAHSWVEVFFPGIGWVTRDPTPSDSPARSQLDDVVRTAPDGALDTPADTRGAPAPQADAATSGATASSVRRSHSAATAIAAGLAGALALIGVLLAVRRRRRLRAAAVDPVAGPLAELRRALRRSGLPPSPQTTLETLAWRYRGTAAEGYLRTLAAARYGYGGARPTRAQRAALRRLLGSGRGPGRRLRAWWALPPRAPAWRLPARPSRGAARERAART